ncbi:MAG: adenosylcobinamide-GDP ribazoletransferase, partial [Methyloceanibacter sp.]
MGAPWAAIRFLSRLPVPGSKRMQASDIEVSATWAPAVGLLIGLVLAIVQFAMARLDPWLSAYCTLLVWLWITGAMHVDGAADLADALGALHRDPDRFLTVLRDPRLGTFGVLAVICIVLAKLLALHALATDTRLSATLILIPAWARLGALFWASRLPPLSDGSGRLFRAGVRGATLLAWFVSLTAASVMLAPLVIMTPLLLIGWAAFLK